MKQLIAALLLILCGVKSAFAETVKVDFIFDLSSALSEASDVSLKNELVWIKDKEKTSDFYDAISGASVNFSAKIAAESFLPESIKKLALFAVSSPKIAKKDALFAEKSADNSIDITFVHRGVAYWIASDSFGRVDPQDGCSMSVICERIDGVFLIKDEFLKENSTKEDMQNVNWDAVEFEADPPKEKSGYTLKKSKIKISLDGTILRLHAVFSWKKDKTR